MKNTFPRVRLQPNTSVSLIPAHRAIHLRHGELWAWQKLARVHMFATELLALCYCVNQIHTAC